MDEETTSAIELIEELVSAKEGLETVSSRKAKLATTASRLQTMADNISSMQDYWIAQMALQREHLETEAEQFKEDEERILRMESELHQMKVKIELDIVHARTQGARKVSAMALQIHSDTAKAHELNEAKKKAEERLHADKQRHKSRVGFLRGLQSKISMAQLDSRE